VLPQAAVVQQDCGRSSAAVPLALQLAEDSSSDALCGLLRAKLE